VPHQERDEAIALANGFADAYISHLGE